MWFLFSGGARTFSVRTAELYWFVYVFFFTFLVVLFGGGVFFFFFVGGFFVFFFFCLFFFFFCVRGPANVYSPILSFPYHTRLKPKPRF